MPTLIQLIKPTQINYGVKMQ